MFEYSFTVKHEGCWTADIHEQFPNFSATILHSHAFADSSSTTIKVTGTDKQTVDRVVDWMNGHTVIRSVDLVRYKDDVGIVTFQTDYRDSETTPVGTVFRTQPFVPLASPRVRNGFEHCHLLLTNREQVRSTFEELQEYGPVEIRSLNELNVTHATSDLSAVSRAITALSPRQRQLFSRAITRGYYEIPQACTIEDLAETDDATMSTVAEHIRRAEKKIFHAIEPLLSEDEGT